MEGAQRSRARECARLNKSKKDYFVTALAVIKKNPSKLDKFWNDMIALSSNMNANFFFNKIMTITQ